MSFENSLYPLVITGDAVGARDLLAGLEGKDLAEAKAWFAKATRWYRNIPESAFDDASDPHAHHLRWIESHWIMALCAVELCGPATAATRVGWDDLHERPGTTSHRLFVEAVCAKDHQWVAEFVEAASHQAGLPKGDLLRAINAEVPVPCPSGPGYLPPWTTYYATDEVLAEEVAADPWMPEILFHVLDNGDCAMWPNLPSAVKVAVSRGLVDRTRVVSHVLGLLTSPQRPASQRVLIGLLEALELRDEELPGLDYVLGVMATSVGTVGKVLLPAAVRMVGTPDEVLQLVSLVGARTEKGQKVVVLNALKTDIRARFGDPVVAEVLPMLLDDDAAFSARVRVVLSGITAAPDVAHDDLAPMGLWAMTPTPTQRVPLQWPGWDHVSWGQHLCRYEGDNPKLRAFLVDQLLRSLSLGDNGQLMALRQSLLTWLTVGDLVLSRFTTLLPDLFLAGAMSMVWPVAMEVADECCQRYERPGTTPALLRTMAQYAHEAPHGDLPYSIAALAADKGSTKIQMEARTLGAALSRMEPTQYLHALHTAPPEPPAPVTRGLWRESAGEPVHRDDRLDAVSQDLDDLRRLAARKFGSGEPHHSPHCPKVTRADGSEVHLWQAELLLAATVGAVREHGAPAVRRCLSGITRQRSVLPVVAAIDVWALGQLTAEVYWKASNSTYGFLNTHLRGIAFTTDADLSAVQVAELRPDADRLAFLRACESLVLAEHGTVVLAAPTYADGTLDIDDLLGRLAQLRGPVGALDVMQALYRLRPCDPSAAESVPLGTFLTDPALTTPEGGSTVDAGAWIREWVAAGGMPRWEMSLPSDGGWRVESRPPIGWDRVLAAPRLIREMRWYYLGGLRNVLTLVPSWPRLVRMSGDSAGDPLGCCGAYGPQLRDAWRSVRGAMGGLHAGRYHSEVGKLDEAERIATELVPEVNRFTLGVHALIFRTLFDCGALKAAWGTALANAVTELRSGGTEVADHLRVLTMYAHEVPEPVVPEELRTFAGEPGADVVHVQARLLVAALVTS